MDQRVEAVDEEAEAMDHLLPHNPLVNSRPADK